MTADQWDDLSFWTDLRYGEWQRWLTWTIIAQARLAGQPPGPYFDEGSEQTVDDNWNWNDGITAVMEQTETTWGINRSKALMNWCDRCLAWIAEYRKKFEKAPNDHDLDEKSRADLQAMKDAYNRLNAHAQERPLT